MLNDQLEILSLTLAVQMAARDMDSAGVCKFKEDLYKSFGLTSISTTIFPYLPKAAEAGLAAIMRGLNPEGN